MRSLPKTVGAFDPSRWSPQLSAHFSVPVCCLLPCWVPSSTSSFLLCVCLALAFLLFCLLPFALLPSLSLFPFSTPSLSSPHPSLQHPSCQRRQTRQTTNTIIHDPLVSPFRTRQSPTARPIHKFQSPNPTHASRPLSKQSVLLDSFLPLVSSFGLLLPSLLFLTCSSWLAPSLDLLLSTTTLTTITHTRSTTRSTTQPISRLFVRSCCSTGHLACALSPCTSACPLCVVSRALSCSCVCACACAL